MAEYDFGNQIRLDDKKPSKQIKEKRVWVRVRLSDDDLKCLKTCYIFLSQNKRQQNIIIRQN